MALEATPKHVAANSYCDDTFAQAYFESRTPNVAWTSNSSLQENALITATNRLEQERYKGARTTTTQALKVPRTGLTDDDGQAVNPDVVPIEFMRAECELAYAILAAGTSDITAGTGLEAFKALAVGPIRLDMRDPEVSDTNNPNAYPKVPGDPANYIATSRAQLPFQVQRLLRRWLITDQPASVASGWGTVRLSKS
jgi:hypothetical protein